MAVHEENMQVGKTDDETHTGNRREKMSNPERDTVTKEVRVCVVLEKRGNSHVKSRASETVHLSPYSRYRPPPSSAFYSRKCYPTDGSYRVYAVFSKYRNEKKYTDLKLKEDDLEVTLPKLTSQILECDTGPAAVVNFLFLSEVQFFAHQDSHSSPSLYRTANTRSTMQLSNSGSSFKVRRSSSASSSDVDVHIKAVLQNDFSSIPAILSIVPHEDWFVLADHLFAYHSEMDAWPLVVWAASQRTPDDITLTGEQFHDMIAKRNLFSDLTVKWNRSLIEDFYIKAKSSYMEFTDFEGVEEKQKISDLISIILKNFADTPPEDMPLLTAKSGALFNDMVGAGDEACDRTHFLYLDIAIIPLVLNPTLVNLDDIHYVRPQKLQSLLDECGRLLHRFGKIREEPLDEPYQSMLEERGAALKAAVPVQFSWATIEKMEKIWKAHNLPNARKLKRLEHEMREMIEGHSDEARSGHSSQTTETGYVRLLEKMKEPQWKAGKVERGVTEYSLAKGDGIGAMVEAEISGEISVLRKLIEDIFHQMKLFSKVEMDVVDRESSNLQFRIQAPFPFSPRYVSAEVQYYAQNGEAGAVIHQSDSHSTPSGHQRAKVLLSGVHVSSLGRSKVKVLVMIHIDMCSSIPNWAASSQSSSIRKNLAKIFREMNK
ncbi:hypothetical protein PROFUN_09637 [Planoprotostelium fungivorum]|uniref:START domain-containing protein n=1 Tax=Planoprotostelium fungivorum TaxID=1890364 RepID=A0A2P6MNY7_9EUKA|nr:hypothetical protein PROFUN_09637 [Planoprotostelium fungivorum]